MVSVKALETSFGGAGENKYQVSAVSESMSHPHGALAAFPFCEKKENWELEHLEVKVLLSGKV